MGFALMTPASADPLRDTALRDCSVASIKRYSYGGSQYDKEQQRYDFYRTCMFARGQPE
jgi:hypothetical protein